MEERGCPSSRRRRGFVRNGVTCATFRTKLGWWAVAALLVLAVGCGDGGDDAEAVPAEPTTEIPGGPLPTVGADLDTRVDAAIERARAFLRGQIDTIPADGIVGLDLLARRYDEPLVDPARSAEDMRARLEADGRIADPSAAITLRVVGDASVLDEVEVPDSYGESWFYLRALGCERRPLDDGWVAANDAALAAGGYETTHVLLGLRWAEEIGCEMPDIGDLRERAVAALDEIIDKGDRPDIAVALEAAAFRSYATDWDPPPEVVELALGSQRPDGGWPERTQDEASHWHAGALGLWVLLAHQQPDAPDTDWVREP